MGVPKSLDLNEFVRVLFVKLFSDLAQRYPEHEKSLRRDLQTFEGRLATEGLSFATKTLPKFGKEFDLALDSGTLVPSPYFKKSGPGQVIPAFMQGLLRMLFSPSGHLVEHANTFVIRDIRQVCFLVYKLQVPYSKPQEDAVITAFLETERELSELDLSSTDLSVERELVSEVLQGINLEEVTPKHGPGSVATGERLEQKWNFSRLYSGIHRVYPYYRYYMVGAGRELLDRIKWYRSLQRVERGVAKVVLVPKDSRGPRLISCEPLEYQWIQQGINRVLVNHLERVSTLTRGMINFSDQSVNREVARESSLHHYFSTLDLKDASDRVSVKLVKELFPEHLHKYLMAARSHATRLPDGREINLEKFAPMGSAICFSVEALVFWAISVAAVARSLRVPVREAARGVYTYGDDIIVPTLAFDAVTEALEAVGLKVNRQKCCSNGNFRESCGIDAYDGVDVTPTRISTCWSTEPSSGACLASYASYANSFWQKGYVSLALHIRASLERSHGVLPYGTRSSGYPCVLVDTASEAETENLRLGLRSRFNVALQRLEFKVKTLIPTKSESTLDGWPRLLRQQVVGFVERPDEVVHPRSTRIRQSWIHIWN